MRYRIPLPNKNEVPMSIHQWPSSERPREKLIEQGAQALSDAELLAIFLRVGVKGKSAVDLGRQLVTEFGGIRGVMDASRKDLCKVPGLGETKYAQLHAALEIGRRYLAEQIKRGPALKNSLATIDYLKLKLQHLGHEVFACLFLGSNNQVIKYEELSHGTVDSAHVYSRHVVKRAVALDANAVIFAHNHPSGISEPSQADRHLTEQLQDALRTVDVRVIDHLVIGDGEPVSFANRGWL